MLSACSVIFYARARTHSRKQLRVTSMRIVSWSADWNVIELTSLLLVYRIEANVCGEQLKYRTECSYSFCRHVTLQFRLRQTYTTNEVMEVCVRKSLWQDQAERRPCSSATVRVVSVVEMQFIYTNKRAVCADVNISRRTVMSVI